MMSELTTIQTDLAPRPLPELEAEIRYYKRQTVEGVIGIGRALAEAKAQVSRGDWLPWLERVEISARSAENYMRVAREIAPGSALAALPYSKALALIEAPPETREQLLDEGVEDKSAAEIKRLTQAIKEEAQHRRRAEEEAKELRASAQAGIARVNMAERAAKAYKDQLDELSRTPPKTVTVEKTVEVAPPDYNDLRLQVETLRRQLADAEAAAEDAERRASGFGTAEEEPAPEGISVIGFVSACNDFMGRVQFYPYHAQELAALGDDGRRQLEIFARGVQNWALRMLGAVAAAGGAVDCEGAVSNG